MKKYALPLIFGLILTLSNNCNCQGIYDNPDSLVGKGDFINAKIALKKKIFDLTNEKEVNSFVLDNFHINLAKINFEDKNYGEAYNCLKKVVSDSLIIVNDIKYKRAFYAYLASDFATCEYEVESERAINTSKMDARMQVLEVLALNEMGKWDKAHQLCKTELYQTGIIDSIKLKKCEHFYSKTPKLKSEKKAEILNMFIPGAAFFYLGKNKDGAINASLQLVSLGLTAVLVWQKLYVSSFFIGLGLYGKFKTGSSRQIPALVQEVNLKKKYDYNLSIRRLILQ